MRANLAALATLRTLQTENRAPAPEEQATMARWSGWGAVPQVFDPDRSEYAWARGELNRLLSEAEYAAASRSTLNAHYTDAELVEAIWGRLGKLGFDGGRVLEPGCGSGNFIGFAPSGARMVGVEREPVTAGIAAALYPDAQILGESFAATRTPDGSFDAAVGNVPFGDVTLTDRSHNPAGHSIHNHFILKSLHATRPGGLVAVLTSRYTMDARNPAARREMAQLADLVGAVRLPNEAHQRAAGTTVVTDLLILRRREPDRDPDDTAWERTRTADLPGGQGEVNEYFLTHPEAVLGELTVDRGPYHAADIQVRGRGQVTSDLAAALDHLTGQAQHRRLTYHPTAAEPTPEPIAVAGGDTQRFEGYLAAHADGTFTRQTGGQTEPYHPPARQANELAHLLGLRDTTVALLETEAGSRDDTAELDHLRAELNQRYDNYTATYGPLNRFSWRRTGRTDPDTGEDRLARIRPPQGGFRRDPFAPTVYALEHFDATTQHAAKADIFTQRVIAPPAPQLGADSPEDALAICLDTRGEVRLDEIARLLGVDEHAAREDLGTLVYDEPGTSRLVPASEYLSGNVRAKLATAREAAAHDSRYAPNVDALTAALPDELGPGEINLSLGVSWIDADYVQQFLRETLDDPTLQVEHPGGSMWTVRGGNKNTVAATSTWGTERAPSGALAQRLLEQNPIRVTDETDDGKRVLNPTATVAAQQKADELNQRFAEWVWEDPDRAAALTRVYNDTFNAVVLRSYDDAQLSLPGLAATFEPRPHQIAAVARITNEPAVLLGHEVGAGKTAEMAMGAMELRRLGMVTKPAVVVPNHMLEQFQTEFLQLYPQARVLGCTREDLTRERRREFVARCATGDWDAVILTRSAFERIPMSSEAQRAYMDQERQQLQRWIANSQSDRSLSVKRVEAALERAEQRLEKKLDVVKDVGITFEQTGIDYLFIDEAHGYKNLRTPSHIEGVAIDGSARATDLDMKLDYLRRNRGDRVATFATATPLSNSMTEAYVMQRYLRPDLLHEAGLEDFDSWAAVFGQLTTDVEMAPEGGSFRMKTRFAKFHNVPELLRMWHVSADIKTAEELHQPKPDIAGGQPETVVVDASPELLDYMSDLSARAEDVRNRAVDPATDNMLKITGDGNAVSLHPRLRRLDTSAPTKVDRAAETIAAIWADHRDDTYLAAGGETHPTRGSLQLVFSDLGTPGPGWNVYDELRDQLAARGLPRGAVRFMHEAKNDKEKAELFAACRSGQVSVLIGSTEKMGVGTNVQTRAVAVHHLDCPWRPADIDQREGRVRRQGNQNPHVRVVRYVTADSLDAYRWQTVERKARFIAQVMRGRLDVREIEDIGESALSYAEVKALAAGDPRLMEKNQVDADLQRLEQLARAWSRKQTNLASDVRAHQRTIETQQGLIADLDAALTHRVDTRGDAFTMQIEGVSYDKRPAAGQALKNLLGRGEATLHANRDIDLDLGHVGSLGGFPLRAGVSAVHDEPVLTLNLEDVPHSTLMLDSSKLADTSPTGLVTRLENRLGHLEDHRAQAKKTIQQARDQINQAHATLGRSFPQQDELDRLRARAQELDQELGGYGDQPDDATAAPSAEPPAEEDPSDRATTRDAGSAAEEAARPDGPTRLAQAAFPDHPYTAPHTPDRADSEPTQERG